jgi:hypothetical protein
VRGIRKLEPINPRRDNMPFASYPTKHCPPELFEYNQSTETLLKTLAEMQYVVLVKKEKDPQWALRHVQGVINSIIGQPKPTMRWAVKYHDLWNRVITVQMHLGYPEGRRFIKSIYEPLTDHYLSALLKRDDTPTVSHLWDVVRNPWSSLFCLWHAMGRREYIVSKGLCQKLRQTKLKGYPADRLMLPYDAIYIDAHDYGDFGNQKVEGCLAYKVSFDTEQYISLGLIIAGETKERFPRLINIEKTDGSIERSMEKSMKIYEESEYITDVEPYRKPWREFFSYIINVILYATMPDAESVFQHYDPTYTKLQKRLEKQKSPKKRKKIKQQLKNAPTAGYTLLGGSIKVDRTEERTNLKGDGIRKVTVRSLISGHWRDQACGKDRMDRKRIWIEPFWRGPEGAPITQKRHHLQ